MNLNVGQFAKARPDARREFLLATIALAISPSIATQKSLWVVLPLIGLLAVIVLSLVFALFGPRRR